MHVLEVSEEFEGRCFQRIVSRKHENALDFFIILPDRVWSSLNCDEEIVVVDDPIYRVRFIGNVGW